MESNQDDLSDHRDDVVINVCVTGRSGVGKSRLCNSIVGSKKFKIGNNMDVETTEVASHEFCWNTNPRKIITVCDTPGLGDQNEDAYLRTLQEKCMDVDIILYCISYKDLDLSPVPSKENESLCHIRRVLYSNPMKHMIIVLTKVNLAKEREKPTLQKEIKQLGTKLNSCFDDLSTIIPVIPAGLPSDTVLRRNSQGLPWLHQLLHEILKQVGELRSFDSLIRSHPHTKDRLTYDESTFAEKVPYSLNSDEAGSNNNAKTILGVGASMGTLGAIAGAGVGATVGALAIGVPTFGVAAGAGLVLGGAIGAGIGGAAGTAATAAGVVATTNLKSNKP